LSLNLSDRISMVWFIHAFLWVRSRNNTNTRGNQRNYRSQIDFMLMRIQKHQTFQFLQF